MEHDSHPIVLQQKDSCPSSRLKGVKTNLLLGYIFKQKAYHTKTYALLKDVFDSRFYHYGNHFKFHPENYHLLPFKAKVRNFLYNSIVAAHVFLFQKRKKNGVPTVLSTVYFGADQFFKNEYSLNISRPPWAYNTWRSNIYNWQLYKKSNALRKQFTDANFHTLISDAFLKEVQDYKDALKKYVSENNIISLFLAHDTSFFERLTIDVFKELNLPTFSFAHGLQFWLNEEYFFRTDYFVTWGKLSKMDFIRNGMAEEKVLVSGHPSYKPKENLSLRFGLENVLVLTNSLNGIAPSDDYMLTDRSDCIYYLFLLQDSLSKLGVQSVHLRPHPSENPEWYKKNVDNRFFHIDLQPLASSLNSSTLVIGPTSTVFLEALYHGVNYLVFNPPSYSGKAISGFRTPPMFDGAHPKVPVAKNQTELEHLITIKKPVDVTILQELIAEEFSLDEVHEKLKNFKKN